MLDSGSVRTEFTTTTPELHEMRVTHRPGSPLPQAHLHPAQSERFDVHEGALAFLVDGVERTVRAGESIELPPGSVHQAHNPGGVPVVASCGVAQR